jgi:hypothetical protein
MRAPMIPGRKPDDDQHREAMLRRLGIAEGQPAPAAASRWDAMFPDVQPTVPVQTPPPMALAANEPLAEERPAPMPETPQTLAAIEEPAAAEPVEAGLAEPQPAPSEPAAPTASEAAAAGYMPGWGEESIPEDEEDPVAEALAEPEAEAEPEAMLEPEPEAEIVAAAEPEVEPEAEAEPQGPSAEVIFIEHAMGAAAEKALEAADVEEEPEFEPLPPLVQALEQIKADLEVLCQYVQGAPSDEIALATPLAAELLQLGAVLYSRAQPA